jgi:hypothetical protein
MAAKAFQYLPDFIYSLTGTKLRTKCPSNLLPKAQLLFRRPQKFSILLCAKHENDAHDDQVDAKNIAKLPARIDECADWVLAVFDRYLQPF